MQDLDNNLLFSRPFLRATALVKGLKNAQKG